MTDLGDLVQQAQAGDLEAFAALVRQCHPLAVRSAAALLGDLHLAEDVAQEACIQAYLDLPQLREPHAFAAWLRRIVFTHCDRITRRATYRRTTSLALVAEPAAPNHDPAELAAHHDLRRNVRVAIATLPDHERTVVAMYYLGDYSGSEIAALLGIAPATVRKRLQLARRRLHGMLGETMTLLPQTTPTDDERFAQMVLAAITAIKTGDVPHLVALLDQHPRLATMRSADGRSLLGHVADWPANIVGGAALVDALVRAGARIDDLALHGPLGETPLQWAVSADDVAVADALIRAGAAVNGVNDDRRPLAQALFYNQLRAAALLVERGATIDFTFAAGLGRVDLLPGFLDATGALTPAAGTHHPPVNRPVPPADPAPQAELWEQALLYAAICGQTAAIGWLLDRGTQIDAMPSGFDVRLTALHWAVMRQQMPAVELLIARGADLTICDPQHHATALGWATYHNLEPFAERLRAAGAR